MLFPALLCVGPPEIRLPVPSSADGHFMDLIDARFNDPPLPNGPSATFRSSADPCLDFFFNVLPDTPSATVAALLDAAWEKDALTALKLVCQLRGVRGTGKSDRESFFAAALWLHAHHPKTLAKNVASFSEFGDMKDLLEILYRLLNGADTLRVVKEKRRKKRRSRGRRRLSYPNPEEAWIAGRFAESCAAHKARELRHKERVALALRVLDRYARDPHYRYLHDRIVKFFADLLASDLEQLNAGRLDKIGLAAKCCPSLGSFYDRATLLCESIARLMFPQDADPEYKELEEQHYAYQVRNRLRTEVLVPLRKALELPEVYMGAGQWDSIPYNRVSSVAMKKYNKIFKKHDYERFFNYLEEVNVGNDEIATEAVLPHELLAAGFAGTTDVVADLQWRTMVRDILEKGKLSNCMAVCDVSSSMKGTPMIACIALGMLISEVSEEPWKGRVITFSKKPQLNKIAGNTLIGKMKFMKHVKRRMNTADFQKVFDLILTLAVEGGLPRDKMIERLFVFSDMEFDRASVHSWETDYGAIRRKFQEKGYVVPEIVFWKLRDSESVPVTAYQQGVALVSGFSKNLVNIFMERSHIINPVAIMEAAIAGEEYSKLCVFD